MKRLMSSLMIRNCHSRFILSSPPPLVIPAQAGIHGGKLQRGSKFNCHSRMPLSGIQNLFSVWIPAFAGMTLWMMFLISPARAEDIFQQDSGADGIVVIEAEHFN